MSATNKSLKRAINDIGPQFYCETIDDYVIAKGDEEGTPFYRARGTIAMEAWEYGDVIPVPFPSNRYGFSIVNDGIADLTFTINGYTRTVKPGEPYNALFKPFTSITINATSAYRAEVLL